MKRICIFIVASLFALNGFAQRSQVYATSDAPLTEGIELYQSGHFTASQRVLSDYLSKPVDPHNQDLAEFYYAANAFELRQKQASKLLKAFRKAHAYSPYNSEVHFMLGVLWAERGKYKISLKELNEAQSKELFRQHVDACLFYKGYAHLHMNEAGAAVGLFQRLHAKEESTYYLQSRYYYAYCQYALGNYNKALPDFLFVEQTDAYKNIAPYYIIQIYYAQGKYDEVQKRADKLLADDPDNDNNCELYRIMGEITYQQGNYAQAIEFLGKYQTAAAKQNATLVREDLYLLGMSCYKLEKYDDAIQYLSTIKNANDSITQSAQYHLGSAYLKTLTTANKATNLQQAKTCFASAMRMDYDATIKEEAMYNYALTSYQSSSALGESVTAFTDFLNNYPESSHREEVYSMLSDAFMSTKNYSSALEALNKISNPNKKMLETKQYLRYQLGCDCFLQGQLAKANVWFDEVISNASDAQLSSSPNNRTYKTEALYMKAEALYRLQDYTKAASALAEFQKQQNAGQSENYSLAQYLEGYIYFQQKEYKSAQSSFLGFLQVADKSQATYADALNRIGDCYFSQRDFVQAEKYYAQVVALGGTGADYATFQRGYALGLLKRYSDKVTTLERLVAQYPRSDYADDALYEIARAEVQREDNNAAINAYDRLLDSYPNSNLARKAALEKAMLYYNMQNYEQAILAYKTVIKNYPSTDEAYSALEGLETCYVETDNVSEYLAYSKTLGRINMQTSSTKEDSLTYAAAELQYMQGNYQKAATGLKNYLDNYCSGGRYCTSAQYFCADSYYQLGQKDNALREFKALCEIKSNPYMEDGLMRVAELSYDKEDYSTALTYFRKLEKQASDTKNTNIARLGILRCSYYLGDNESTIEVASELIDDTSTDAETVAEARYNRGKAYYAQQQYIKATEDFRIIAEEVRTAKGAEAEYLICEGLYNQGDLSDAETEIMKFAKMNTSQQYWLAKAFILLSDIYVKNGDDFMAEQYLLSLQENYKTQDDIQTAITERLQLIQDRSNENVEESTPVSSGDSGSESEEEDDEDEDDDK